jgi:hypothetical protein
MRCVCVSLDAWFGTCAGVVCCGPTSLASHVHYLQESPSAAPANVTKNATETEVHNAHNNTVTGAASETHEDQSKQVQTLPDDASKTAPPVEQQQHAQQHEQPQPEQQHVQQHPEQQQQKPEEPPQQHDQIDSKLHAGPEDSVAVDANANQIDKAKAGDADPAEVCIWLEIDFGFL